jgi:N-acetylneuraminic acid mutarotase
MGPDRSLYIFGGTSASSEELRGYKKIDNFMKLDVDTGKWTSIDARAGVTGTPPSPRDRHSMTTVGQDVYVFGGQVKSGMSSSSNSDELFKYSTATMTWTKLDTIAGVTGTPPSARSGHSMTTVGEDFYVFGGSDELFKYSTVMMTWTKLDTSASASTPPSARGHSMTTVGEDFYVFGGYTGEAGEAEERIGHTWMHCFVCHQSAGVEGG